MAIGWQRVRTQRGVTIAGNTSVRWRSISKLALPEPMIDRGTQLGDGDGAVGEDRADVVTTAQVLRQRAVVFTEPAEVHDLREHGLGGGVPEHRRRLAVALGELVVAAHGVDEVVRGVDAGHRRRARRRIRHVALHHLDPVGPRPAVELGRRPGQAPHLVPGVEQLGDEAPTDVARRTRHQHPLRSRLEVHH